MRYRCGVAVFRQLRESRRLQSAFRANTQGIRLAAQNITGNQMGDDRREDDPRSRAADEGPCARRLIRRQRGDICIAFVDVQSHDGGKQYCSLHVIDQLVHSAPP